MTTVRWIALPLLLIVMCPPAVADQPRPAPAVVGDNASSQPVAAVQRFSLGLEHEVAPRFRLFGERDGSTDTKFTAPVASEPVSDVALTASLVYSPDQHPVPDDLRINLKPRTWGDLDGWEKLGVVVSYAGSVAGAAYIASRIID